MSFEGLQKSEELFRCPICSGAMKLEQEKSLICGKGHCFDLSRKGYINFLLRPVRTEYDKARLQARNRILTGFWKGKPALPVKIRSGYWMRDAEKAPFWPRRRIASGIWCLPASMA